MQNFLKILHTLFVKGPLGFLLGLVGLVILLVVFIPSLLLRFCEKLMKFWRTRNFRAEKEKKKERCNPPLPEPVMRRPDPCIYSQTYLAAQGVPVTWDNPDIWMAKAATPHVIEPDSYHLQADTDYIVSVQAHNASTDLALGVKVRLLYRPWSFNSPDLLPVAVNANGQEVVRFVNVPGMGSAIAQFTWHTPPVPAGQTAHYCLQAHLSHPLDTNLENNVGQENTNVHSANPGHVSAGELVRVVVPLFNPAGQDVRVVFRADAYAIDKAETIQLQRQTNTGRQRLSLGKRIGNVLPMLLPEGRATPRPPAPPTGVARAAEPARRVRGGYRLVWGRRIPHAVTRARYTGYDTYKQALLSRNFDLPPGMEFDVPEQPQGPFLRARERRNLAVQLKVPNDAQTGQHYSINVRAQTENGRLIGGVTFLLDVKN
ncbi:MAG TPA: hypothetical protein VG095_01355 [Chthoniobacterales bacterium]|nr:hypothetical protein [Chthoniobacterales bacterium]